MQTSVHTPLQQPRLREQSELNLQDWPCVSTSTSFESDSSLLDEPSYGLPSFDATNYSKYAWVYYGVKVWPGRNSPYAAFNDSRCCSSEFSPVDCSDNAFDVSPSPLLSTLSIKPYPGNLLKHCSLVRMHLSSQQLSPLLHLESLSHDRPQPMLHRL